MGPNEMLSSLLASEKKKKKKKKKKKMVLEQFGQGDNRILYFLAQE